MPLARRWAGRAFGTNTGNLFVKIEGEDSDLSGEVKLNDKEFGLATYIIHGRFDGETLAIWGRTPSSQPSSVLSTINATARITPTGELRGDWSSDTGTEGTFILNPHDTSNESLIPLELPQLFTARYNLGAAVIGRDDIIRIAKEISSGFSLGKPIVTIVTNTEQSMFLEKFEIKNINAERASFTKIFIQESESNGLNRIISVEFGQAANMVMTQGSDEAWVLGRLEVLKSYLGDIRRSYVTGIRQVSPDVYRIMLLIAIIYMQSLPDFGIRILFFILILAFFYCSQWLQRKYIPFSVIYIGQRKVSTLRKLAPTIWSWIIAATAGVAGTVTATYLQVWLHKLGG